MDVEESKPTQANRQQYRLNTPSNSIAEYYKPNFTIPMLDHLMNELDTRFDVNCTKNLVEFRQLLPSEVVNKTSMSLDDLATIPSSTRMTFLLSILLRQNLTCDTASGEENGNWLQR